MRTAPDSRDAVTVQETAPGEAPVRRGRSGSRGMTTVCMTAMRVPQYARTGMVRRARGRPVPVLGASIGAGDGMGTPAAGGQRK
ncbi:hypothetical protein GCM10010251_73730 [Streptomyces aurantiogriseus]|uniref:Uncharacterized protein n=1 Tax=Streptomyces aurantiogriseus TaxID=66870 RepID=A0A918KY90_9ACTN|nr:hypothetical protein GCM10010251_73730 [Streptomyces aurantiogriseus]